MNFGLFCFKCKKWETNIHFDIENGRYTLQCLICGNEEVVISIANKPPKTIKERHKRLNIDKIIRDHILNLHKQKTIN